MKKTKRFAWAALTLLLCLAFLAVPVSAKTKKRVNKWYTTKAKNTYYYNQKGQRAKGLTKIGKWHSYYFDEKGIQRTGWQKINGNYYFFRLASAKYGYSVKNKTVNGIELGSDGKAKVTYANSEKLDLLVRANQLMQSLTNNKMTRAQKLLVAFNQAKSIRPYNYGNFVNSASWDVYYAKMAFNTGRADCFGFGAYFAYLANAIGYQASAVSSGGHGWAEVNGLVYDPDWALMDKAHDYFGMSYSLSGVGGRPNYAPNRAYVKTI